MEIRTVKKEEFEELMAVMNESFGFTEKEERFEHILPKLYFPDNPDMTHIGAFADGRLVGCAGLYRSTLLNGDKSLRAGCIGAVATLPGYRGRGVFTNVMSAVTVEAEKEGLDLLFLGGDRRRYGWFGFENAGRNLEVRVSKRGKTLLKPLDRSVERFDGGDAGIIREMLKLYNTQKMRTLRTEADFYVTLKSWNAEIYYVAAGDGDNADRRMIGYFALARGHISEFVYIEDAPGEHANLDTMLDAVTEIRNGVSMSLPMRFYRRGVLDRVDSWSVTHNHMFKILNEDAVIEFLGGDPGTVKAGLPDNEKSRAARILGDAAYDSAAGDNMFINEANSG